MNGPDDTRYSFFRRAVIPALFVTGAWAVAYLVYSLAGCIENQPLYRAVAFISGLVTLTAVILGSPVAYCLAYGRGASVGERFPAAIATQVIWIISELVRVSAYFTPGETFYYALNPAFVQVLFGSVMLMGIAEMVCRRLRQRHGEPGLRVITAGPVLAVLAGILSFLFIFAWEFGTHSFYLYMRGYRLLFL